MRSPSASTTAGGRFGMNLTRLPGFERSSAPDLINVATGESLSPTSASFTSRRRTPTRSDSSVIVDLVDLERGGRTHGRTHRVDDRAEPSAGGALEISTSFGAFGSLDLTGKPAKRREGNTEAEAGRVHCGPDDLVGVLPHVTNSGLDHGARAEHRCRSDYQRRFRTATTRIHDAAVDATTQVSAESRQR